MKNKALKAVLAVFILLIFLIIGGYLTDNRISLPIKSYWNMREVKTATYQIDLKSALNQWEVEIGGRLLSDYEKDRSLFKLDGSDRLLPREIQVLRIEDSFYTQRLFFSDEWILLDQKEQEEIRPLFQWEKWMENRSWKDLGYLFALTREDDKASMILRDEGYFEGEELNRWFNEMIAGGTRVGETDFIEIKDYQVEYHFNKEEDLPEKMILTAWFEPLQEELALTVSIELQAINEPFIKIPEGLQIKGR
ncbi:MAG TPA: hypothetical protein DHN33_06105 [Eubacteriaceae bacterium]|nr:hypothetical protein [Eubacteriaceae bacterium]